MRAQAPATRQGGQLGQGATAADGAASGSAAPQCRSLSFTASSRERVQLRAQPLGTCYRPGTTSLRAPAAAPRAAAAAGPTETQPQPTRRTQARRRAPGPRAQTPGPVPGSGTWRRPRCRPPAAAQDEQGAEGWANLTQRRPAGASTCSRGRHSPACAPIAASPTCTTVSIKILALYFSSLDTTVNSDSRAGRASAYASSLRSTSAPPTASGLGQAATPAMSAPAAAGSTASAAARPSARSRRPAGGGGSRLVACGLAWTRRRQRRCRRGAGRTRGGHLQRQDGAGGDAVDGGEPARATGGVGHPAAAAQPAGGRHGG